MPTFTERLKSARLAAGLSGRAVARAAKMGSGNYSKLESGLRGKRISKDVAARLAKALKVNEDWLIFEIGPRELGATEGNETPFDRAVIRARQDRIHDDAITRVQQYSGVPGVDEEMLYQLMKAEHLRLTNEMEKASPLGKGTKKKKARTEEAAEPKSTPKSKRGTGTE